MIKNIFSLSIWYFFSIYCKIFNEIFFLEFQIFKTICFLWEDDELQSFGIIKGLWGRDIIKHISPILLFFYLLALIWLYFLDEFFGCLVGLRIFFFVLLYIFYHIWWMELMLVFWGYNSLHLGQNTKLPSHEFVEQMRDLVQISWRFLFCIDLDFADFVFIDKIHKDSFRWRGTFILDSKDSKVSLPFRKIRYFSWIF